MILIALVVQGGMWQLLTGIDDSLKYSWTFLGGKKNTIEPWMERSHPFGNLKDLSYLRPLSK